MNTSWYWNSFRITGLCDWNGGLSSQRANNVELWCFLYCSSEHTFKQFSCVVSRGSWSTYKALVKMIAKCLDVFRWVFCVFWLLFQHVLVFRKTLTGVSICVGSGFLTNNLYFFQIIISTSSIRCYVVSLQVCLIVAWRKVWRMVCPSTIKGKNSRLTSAISSCQLLVISLVSMCN